MRVAVLLLAAAAACAQPVYEIRGVVVDKASNQPIPNATVALLKVGLNLEPLPRVMTDAVGAFHFTPETAASYSLNVEAEGYRPEDADAPLTPQKPSQTVRIALKRGATLSGRLIDADTREAIRDYPVSILDHRYEKGHYVGQRSGRVTTDAEGRFQASGLELDDMLVVIWPPFFESEEPNQTEFTAADIEKSDEEYAVTYWPGGPGFETALPVTPTGAPIDVGTIPVRKIAYRRAVVRSPEGCKGPDEYEGWLHAMGVDRTYRSVVTITCGKDVLLRGLIPGEMYRFRVQPTSGKDVETGRRTAEIFFTATDKNLELKPVLRPAVDLEGQVKLADRSSPWPAGLKLGGTAPDAKGRFRFVQAPVGDFGLRITGLGDRHVIQEIRLGGQPLLAQESQTFQWNGVGPLEITLDDKPASLTVTTATKAAIALFRWPIPSARDAIFEARIEVNAGSVTRLAAGEYRVLAVPDAARGKLEEPGVLERLLPRAQKVALERGASLTLDLKTIEP